MVVRREVFESAGGFDEELPILFNDVDFCLRVREKGYRVLWTPYAELYHIESVSRGSDDRPEVARRFQREIQFMQDNWGDTLKADPNYSPNLTYDYEDFSLAFPPRAEKPWKGKD